MVSHLKNYIHIQQSKTNQKQLALKVLKCFFFSFNLLLNLRPGAGAGWEIILFRFAFISFFCLSNLAAFVGPHFIPSCLPPQVIQ